MYCTVTCPVCGHKQRVPEHQMGRKVRCPHCQSYFLAGASTPLETRVKAEPPASAAASPPAPLAPAVAPPAAPGEEPIRYNCPRCGRPLEAPRSMAGQKLNCPGCSQRLQIPTPAPAAAPPVPQVHPAPAPPTSRRPRAARRPPARRERCLECGQDVTGWERVITCPKCGSLFCSAACSRDHEHFAHGG
jgi:DNA-directed RNA polymerase subunit RPC12/RpoP